MAGFTVIGQLPIGLRNNNPGNLRPGDLWQGMTGSNGGFIVFESISWGLRALATDIINKTRRGLDTIAKIIAAYAPVSDNNNVPSYIAAVSQATGIGANQILQLDGPTLHDIMRGIVDHENGSAGQLVTDSDIDTGISMVSGDLLQLLEGVSITTAAAIRDNPGTTVLVLGVLALGIIYLSKN